MDERIRHALSRGHRVDITTIGRRSGRPRRITVVFHNFGGHVYISGRPGRRDWYANLLANPRFTFHLVRPISADLPAQARPITAPDERLRVMSQVAEAWGVSDHGRQRMMDHSPLVEVTFDQAA